MRRSRACKSPVEQGSQIYERTGNQPLSERARMKRFKTIPFLLALAALALWVPGCATQNVNPPQARANTGYLDFHADPSEELCWQVARFDDRTQSFKSVFSDLEPPPDRVLRLAFVPGHYRMRITFLNRVISKPAEVEVEVKDGMITPVQVALIPDGTTLVEHKEQRLGPTIKGRYRNNTKYSSNESTMYRVSAGAEVLTPYQVKERTVYAR
jgi:hypothetical protein